MCITCVRHFIYVLSRTQASNRTDYDEMFMTLRMSATQTNNKITLFFKHIVYFYIGPLKIIPKNKYILRQDQQISLKTTLCNNY